MRLQDQEVYHLEFLVFRVYDLKLIPTHSDVKLIPTH